MADKNLFRKEYSFYGKHAGMSRDFVDTKIDSSGARLFQSNIELFIFCSLYGVIQNRKASPDTQNKGDTNKIFAEQFSNHADELKRAFRFVTLTGNKERFDAVTRLNKTFRNPETDENYAAFEEYMLGGLEELHDRVMVASNIKYEDYLTAINKVIEELAQEEAGAESVDPSTDDFF